MLSKAVQDAINEQINSEFYSAYLYLSMASYFEAANLRGSAHWMRVQSQEEWSHAMKLFDYVNDQNGRVVLQGIEQPPAEFTSSLDVFQQTLDHERKVTAMINRVYDLAAKENDRATQVALQWFITEQVQEEKAATMIVEQLDLIGESTVGLLMLDSQLGQRPAA